MDLDTAIDKLYEVFSIYPPDPGMEGCPCCVGEQDRHKLSYRSLRELSGEDLSRYAFKAMTTWGTEDNFKHFLPRIFDLLASGGLQTDEFVVLGKLEYAGWKNWTETEQQAIRALLLAWWEARINYTYLGEQMLIEVYRRTGDIDQMLASWDKELSIDTYGFHTVVDLAYFHIQDLKTRSRDFFWFTSDDSEKILQWLKSKADLLEEGFFLYEKQNPAYARQISNALYILENSPLD